MRFARGDIYQVRLTVAGQSGVGVRQRDKFLIILQDLEDDDPVPSVSFALASTHGGAAAHAYELVVGPDDAACFDRPTVIDGRHVYTTLRAAFDDRLVLGTLDQDTMDQLGACIGLGLHLYPGD